MTETSLDQFGIKIIVPSKPQTKAITDFKLESKKRNYASGKPSEWSVEYTAKAPFDELEATYYCKLNGFKKHEPDTVSTKILGGSHTDGKGHWYIFELQTDGKSNKNFETEKPHPKNHANHQKTNFTVGESIIGKWVGYKIVTYLVNGGKDRRLEYWLDYPVADISKPSNNWRMYWGVTDTGQLKNGHIIKRNGDYVTCRIDGVEEKALPDFKYASVREIVAPTGTTPPPNPPGPVVTETGVIKPGGWGASTDPKTWTVTNMKSPPEQFKIVDNKGVNVATNFTTKENAQKVIDAAIAAIGGGGGGPTNPPNPPAPTTGFGAYGVKSIFGNGKVHTEYRDNSRPDGKRRDFQSIGTKGVELTGCFALTSPIDDEVSGKFSTLSHSGSNKTNCYDMGVSTKGGRSRIRFEATHPSYTGNLGEGHTPAPALGNKFIGYKFIKVANPDKTVTCYVYVDTGDNEGDKPANQWKEIFKWVDTKYKIDVVQPFATIRIDDPSKGGLKQLKEKWIHAQEIN